MSLRDSFDFRTTFEVAPKGSLHRALKEIADRENISTNQFVTLAVAEKISALATTEFFEQRAGRAPDRRRFDELLAKAPEIEPDEDDRPWKEVVRLAPARANFPPCTGSSSSSRAS